MSIKQTMATPIKFDAENVRAVVNEAADGIKAVPVELVTKAGDDSTFNQVNASNGLPVQVVAAIPAGANEIGKVKLTDGADTLAINPDGSVNTVTTLTGSLPSGTNTIGKVDLNTRLIEEIIVLNASAIVDTTARYSTSIDLTKYRSVEVFVSSTLNQAVDVAPVVTDGGDNFATNIWNGTAFAAMPVSTVPASVGNPNKYLLSGRYDFLAKSPPKTIKMYYKPAVAPTSGSLTIKIWGVPN